MSESVNKPLTIAENIFKSLVWEPALKAATVSYPVLAVWPISALVSTITDYIFTGFSLVVDVGAIQLLNADHQSAYIKSSVTLQVIAREKGITSKEFQDARDTALIVLSRFTRVNQ